VFSFLWTCQFFDKWRWSCVTDILCSHLFELCQSVEKWRCEWRTFCALIHSNLPICWKVKVWRYVTDILCSHSFELANPLTREGKVEWPTFYFVGGLLWLFIGGEDPGRGKRLYLEFSHWLVSPLRGEIPKSWEVQHQLGWTSTYTVLHALIHTLHFKNVWKHPKKNSGFYQCCSVLDFKRNLVSWFFYFFIFLVKLLLWFWDQFFGLLKTSCFTHFHQ
jgi:hypothetical protein